LSGQACGKTKQQRQQTTPVCRRGPLWNPRRPFAPNGLHPISRHNIFFSATPRTAARHPLNPRSRNTVLLARRTASCAPCRRRAGVGLPYVAINARIDSGRDHSMEVLLGMRTVVLRGRQPDLPPCHGNANYLYANDRTAKWRTPNERIADFGFKQYELWVSGLAILRYERPIRTTSLERPLGQQRTSGRPAGCGVRMESTVVRGLLRCTIYA
jgi:hypothetical protein